MINFVPWKDKIVVRPSKVAGVIVGPTGKSIHPTQGMVVATGNACKNYANGDVLIYGPHSGVWIKVEDEEYLCMGEFEAFGKLTGRIEGADVPDNKDTPN